MLVNLANMTIRHSNHGWRLAVLLIAFLNSLAMAQPALVLEDDVLIGARGFDFEGTYFQVEFIDGSCIQLLDGCDEPGDFPFESVVEAEAASAALQALLSPRGYSIRGCDPDLGCSLLTPIDLSEDSGRVRAVDLFVGTSSCTSDCATQYGWETPEPDSDLSNQADMVYAIWRPLAYSEVISWDVDPGIRFFADVPESTATLSGSFSYDQLSGDAVVVNLTTEAGFMIRCLPACESVESRDVSGFAYNAGLKTGDGFIAYDQLDASDGVIERMLWISAVGDCELNAGVHEVSIAEWFCNGGDCDFRADRAEEFFFRTGDGTISTIGSIPEDLCPLSSSLPKLIVLLKESGKI